MTYLKRVRAESDQCENNEVWTGLWLDHTNPSDQLDQQKSAISKYSRSLAPIVCLSLKCSVSSGWIPFIWSSLICGGLKEEEESQVSTSRSDNTVCWSRQVRKVLCENVVTFWSFISNWKQGQEDHEFILILRIELLHYMQMRQGACEKHYELGLSRQLSHLSLTKTNKKWCSVIALWQLIAKIQCYWLAVSALLHTWLNR